MTPSFKREEYPIGGAPVISYELTDAYAHTVQLTPSEAMDLLTWLDNLRGQLVKDMHPEIKSQKDEKGRATMYTYSFQYDARGDGATTIGNFYEAEKCLHILPGQPGYDESYLDLEQLCREQVERERPGVNVTSLDIMGVHEPDGNFYYLPDHIQNA